jgi:hypothetical protein
MGLHSLLQGLLHLLRFWKTVVADDEMNRMRISISLYTYVVNISDPSPTAERSVREQNLCYGPRLIKFWMSCSGVQLSLWARRPLIGLLYQCRTIDGYETFGEMRTGKGNRSTRRGPAPQPLCPPQILYELDWDRTGPLRREVWGLTAWIVKLLRRCKWFRKVISVVFHLRCCVHVLCCDSSSCFIIIMISPSATSHCLHFSLFAVSDTTQLCSRTQLLKFVPIYSHTPVGYLRQHSNPEVKNEWEFTLHSPSISMALLGDTRRN